MRLLAPFVRRGLRAALSLRRRLAFRQVHFLLPWYRFVPRVAAFALPPGGGESRGSRSREEGISDCLPGSAAEAVAPGQSVVAHNPDPNDTVAAARHQAGDEPGQAGEAGVEAIDGGDLETLLLVEDEEILREFCARILRDQGYRVLTAAGGEQALDIEDCEPQLLVTDVVMPGMTGPELVQRLRQRGADMPVIFISGYPQKVVLRRDDESFLQKPFAPADLCGKIREVLDRRRES